jgi:hypothetical protein
LYQSIIGFQVLCVKRIDFANQVLRWATFKTKLKFAKWLVNQVGFREWFKGSQAAALNCGLAQQEPEPLPETDLI